jgi:hypothetical protein
MRRTIVLLAAMAAMVVVYAGTALAASVDELEPNGGYLCCAGAQNIDDYFSLDADSNITNLTGTENTSTTVPHATINGTGDNTYDYYSFTVPEFGVATFDIDGGYNTNINGLRYDLDSCLRLFDSLAAEQENNNGFIKANCDQSYRDPGSQDLKDSALEYPLNPGTYYVKVGTYFDNVIEAGAGYTLHVSIPNHVLQDTAPSVISTVPGKDGTLARTANVTAHFSEAVQHVNTNTFKLEHKTVTKKGTHYKPIAATVTTSDNDTTAVLNPTPVLPKGSYRATLTNGVTDTTANALKNAPYTWSFTV